MRLSRRRLDLSALRRSREGYLMGTWGVPQARRIDLLSFSRVRKSPFRHADRCRKDGALGIQLRLGNDTMERVPNSGMDFETPAPVGVELLDSLSTASSLVYLISPHPSAPDPQS